MAWFCSVLVFAMSLTAAWSSPQKLEKPSCQEFSHEVRFADNQAVGSWHMLHHRHLDQGPQELHCMDFLPVNDEDRKALSERIGKYVENLKWDKLVLKMQVPCADARSNHTRVYYLQKLEGDGSYRTIQIPPLNAKLDLAEFHRYPMRLKLIENQYLAMMDCHEKFVFIMDKQPMEGKLSERLKKIINIYWPEEL